MHINSVELKKPENSESAAPKARTELEIDLNDDKWKDELLVVQRITGLEYLAMPTEKRSFIDMYPKVFVKSINEDCFYNMLHRDNKLKT